MDFIPEFIKATKILIAVCLVTYAFQFIFGDTCTFEDLKGWTINNILFSYPFYFGNAYLVVLLDKWSPGSINSVRKAIVYAAITIAVNLVIIYLVIGVTSYFVYDGPFNYAFTDNGKWTVLIALIIVSMITIMFYAVGFYQEVQSQKLLNETLRRDKVTAELNALKAQVDPHFLFNSFNVLSGLIDEDQDKAQHFLSGLSKIYRYVLENRDEDLVPLSEELDFAQKYMDLHKVRFEDSIKMHVDVDDSQLENEIPSLSLQMLLENIIKHNAFDKSEPLKVEIKTVGDLLHVSNTKRMRRKTSSGNGIGLNNIQQRYDLHQVEGFEYIEEDNKFTVKLPLI